MRILITIVIVMALIPYAAAQDYAMIIEDNGNALVTITIIESGLYELPIPQDTNNLLVRGGLYILNDDSIEISVGETGEAVVLFTTSLLTSKIGNEWTFIYGIPFENNNVIVFMPENTRIISTTPQALIQSGEILELTWNDVNSIEIVYEFSSGTIIENNDNLYMGIAVGILIPIVFIVYYMRRNKFTKKASVIKTLSENEKKVVNLLIKNKGLIRRSVLEKESEISKSSLAATLKNLEKKKIVEVDKKYPAHSVKLTKWFNEL